MVLQGLRGFRAVDRLYQAGENGIELEVLEVQNGLPRIAVGRGRRRFRLHGPPSFLLWWLSGCRK